MLGVFAGGKDASPKTSAHWDDSTNSSFLFQYVSMFILCESFAILWTRHGKYEVKGLQTMVG